MQIEEIKGIGSKTLNLLNKLNIKTVFDLVTYYPFRYDIIKRSDIYSLIQDDHIVIDGISENIPTVFHLNKKMDKMNFKINTGNLVINVVIYNRGFLKNKIKAGTKLTLIGKYDIKHNTIIAANIDFQLLNDIPKIEPIYHTTYGLSSKQLNQYIIKLFNIKTINYIPHYLMEKYKFLSKQESIKQIHNPENTCLLNKAQLMLKYEELFLFTLKMNYLKETKNIVGLKRDVDKNQINDFIEKLPFKLTEDQKIAVDEIYNDLISSKKMNRLLQGDVGSGKTIVSFIAIYINYLSGYQSALMAPTEILANQHFISIQKIFEKYNIQIALLTGKLKAKEKREVYKNLKAGVTSIVIGTHALFTEEVVYNNLGLVITDEQHRFGVNQRSNLKNKGVMPDILYMSATPIPRTYALTLYGDMDISSIKTMPNGRKEIITILRKENEMRDVLERMHYELKLHHQIYVIAPLIEESDKINLENVYTLEEKMNQAFSKICKIGVLHGKMNNQEKEDVMTKFQNNEISILISTTVIEVGIDVQNATMIVIFDSYRFGLSALHQLRGRVGRNNLQSFCILISNREKERLNILTTTNDGFKISEEDFILRGSGDLFGVRQSGDMIFKIADYKKDYKLLLQAKEDSFEYLKENYDKNEEIKKIILNSTNLD
ncbi:MAG: ATP-dependent DNA helicase RecG [Bacilli bacterium]